MAQTSPVGRFIQRLSVARLLAVGPDGELVERFALHGDEAAFAALVRRHGPLVLGACRRVLTDTHAAEDCFQATFLVLARKAGFLKRPEGLGPWLYGVATRTALQARARAARRRVCERRASVAEAVAPCDGPVWRDLRPKLDEAIAALPEKHRLPFVLHHLEGLTVAEVAQRLGCPQGTAAARLARAKEQLRGRLVRQGLAACAGALATLLTRGTASAVVPPSLAEGTIQAAIGVAAGEAAGAFSATAAALTSGGIPVMSVSKVKVALAVLATVSAFGLGVGVSRHGSPNGGHAVAGRGTTPFAGDAPPIERYYAGGFRSLRGFEFRGVPREGGSPPSGCPDAGVNSHEQPAGRLIFGVGVNSDAGLVGSIVLNERNFDCSRPPPAGPECRRPIPANDPPHGVAFLDAGTVERAANVRDYRVTAGTGLRLSVPVLGPVPVALDFGFPLVKAPEEREWPFSF